MVQTIPADVSMMFIVGLVFSWQTARQVKKTTHSYGGKALLHSCGHVQPLVKYFVEAELDALHPLQPTANNWKEVVRTFICRIS